METVSSAVQEGPIRDYQRVRKNNGLEREETSSTILGATFFQHPGEDSQQEGSSNQQEGEEGS